MGAPDGVWELAPPTVIVIFEGLGLFTQGLLLALGAFSMAKYGPYEWRYKAAVSLLIAMSSSQPLPEMIPRSMLGTAGLPLTWAEQRNDYDNQGLWIDMRAFTAAMATANLYLTKIDYRNE